jgi:hypothetical protein
MSHKNDPDYHDLRAKTLLEAANRIKSLVGTFHQEYDRGLDEAAAELRRMASNARREHKKVQDKRRQESRDSEAKAKAFGA